MKVSAWNKTIINLDSQHTNIWPTELFVDAREAEKRFLDEHESDQKLKKLDKAAYKEEHHFQFTTNTKSVNTPIGTLLYAGEYKINWLSCRGEHMLTICTLTEVNL